VRGEEKGTDGVSAKEAVGRGSSGGIHKRGGREHLKNGRIPRGYAQQSIVKKEGTRNRREVSKMPFSPGEGRLRKRITMIQKRRRAFLSLKVL